MPKLKKCESTKQVDHLNNFVKQIKLLIELNRKLKYKKLFQRL